jgi:DNA recombination protein RmuC
MLVSLLLAAATGGLGWFLGRRRVHAIELELAASRAELKTSAEVATEREQALDLALERLRTGFDSVAGQALRGNSETFLTLANQVLGRQQVQAMHQLGEREKSVENLLAPIREALQRTHEQISRIEKDRAETFGALRNALESVTLGQQSLQKETRNLVTALRRPEVRGQWGVMTLRRLVELAGMLEHCDFEEQVHVVGDDRTLRPDMVIRMPDGRQLVVDVKTPLDAYLAAIEAPSDEQRALAVRRHAQLVAERVKALSSKAYWSQFERSPDFVVLFIPGDQFLSAAMGELPNLLEDAIRQDVIIATPSSFIALLKAVAYGWRQDALAENASHIRDIGEELFRRLATFGAHVARMGRTLTQSVEAYNSAVGSLERQVLPAARRFTDLGLRPGRELEELLPIEKLAREPRNGDEAAATSDGDRGD